MPTALEIAVHSRTRHVHPAGLGTDTVDTSRYNFVLLSVEFGNLQSYQYELRTLRSQAEIDLCCWRARKIWCNYDAEFNTHCNEYCRVGTVC